jgi:hypothetical protein
MFSIENWLNEPCRRAFLRRGTLSIGAAALGTLLRADRALADEKNAVEVPNWTGVLKTPHHAPRIRRVIHL